MAPRRNVIIGHLDGVQPPIRRSSRKVRQAPNEVIIGRLEPPASGTQPSGSRERTQTNNEVNIQEPTDLPLQEDVLEAVDDLDDQPGAKVCAFMAQYLICDDCFGANYFCRTCCLDAHQRSPYHRILRWTGSHFVPMSLYQLGFILHLGHHGMPCPNTLEVDLCHISLSWGTHL